MPNAHTKSCLIVTYGPVPTPQYQTVEGGGMRAWGLAHGLKSNGIDATVAINNSFPQEITEHEGVRLINWGLDSEFVQQINSYDAVIISYCMGDPSVFVVDNINDDIQLILDAYVPIYIEVSARDSKDIETEYVNYMADIERFNKVLKRGDYFLYANDAQELLYSGVLSALGIINPRSYRDKRLLKTPFGIHRTPATAKSSPYTSLGISDDDFIVLWFGGIYPWFRIEEYLEAIKILAADKTIKFVFVGGKNPFNPNPDFSRQYETAVAFAEKNKLVNKQVYFVDWVDFQDRVGWYLYANVVVSLNQPGEENKFSWRTRVMDYVWGGVVTISNGSDPLSEELIQSNAAIRIRDMSSNALVDAIKNCKSRPEFLEDLRQNVEKVRNKYFWDIVTENVASVIQEGGLPFSKERAFRNKTGMPSNLILQNTASVPGKFGRLVSLPVKVTRKVKQKGIIRSAKIAGMIVKTQLKNKTQGTKRAGQFVFISHPINNTGAPIVLLQIIEEYVKKYGASRVRVIAPGAEKEQKMYLNRLGVSVEHTVFGVGFRFIRLQLGLQKDDFVLMNTIAIYDNYRDFIMLWLCSGRLRHAYWFIHEDKAQIPFVHKEFLEKRNLDRMKKLMQDNKLTVLTPSKRTKEEYAEIIGIEKNLRPINLHVEVDEKYKQPREAQDYKKLDFLLSGTPSDGRKGQLLALAAFHHFQEKYYKENPDDYRSFALHLVAIGEDYISQQISWISSSLLKKHVIIYPSLPREEALKVSSKCNAVICCSLNETFGLYVAEGMFMGHVVLRNNSAGMDEQLREGVNGYFIDHTNIKQFAKTLEKLLNKSKTTNEDLNRMGQASREIISGYSNQNYLTSITQDRE